jgi:hypothetical protein
MDIELWYATHRSNYFFYLDAEFLLYHSTASIALRWHPPHLLLQLSSPITYTLILFLSLACLQRVTKPTKKKKDTMTCIICAGTRNRHLVRSPGRER